MSRFKDNMSAFSKFFRAREIQQNRCFLKVTFFWGHPLNRAFMSNCGLLLGPEPFEKFSVVCCLFAVLFEYEFSAHLWS